MKVRKRNSELEDFDPSKILKRIQKQATGLKVNADEIAVQTMQGMYDGITTIELDELAAMIAHSYTFSHPDYSKLASNIIVSRLHKECPPLRSELAQYIKPERDYNFDYFGISQLIKSYLLRDEQGNIIETPQYMYMRVAAALGKNLDETLMFYEYLSTQRISVATPILFNAGTKNQNMISCNLTYLKGDSLEDIMDTMKNISIASSDAAGIGLCVDNLRSSKSRIGTSGGKAHGVLGVAKIVNELMNVYNQGGKRPGSCALYLSVWNKDIMDFLNLKLPTGDEKLRARDLFLALNVPNNFMRAVEQDSDYYLFCPKELGNHGIDFLNTHNDQFEREYTRAVELGIGERMKAQDIYKAIIKSQIETGVPYIHFIDHSNRMSNHRIYGKIKQSNLCIEIMQYSDEDTTAQCCLGSIPLQNHISHVVGENMLATPRFDYELLKQSTYVLTVLLNRVIDNNVWSTPEAQKGGIEQRAIAIGVQGLADTFFQLELSYEDEKAKELSTEITRCIYESAFKSSQELSEREKVTYKNWDSDKSIYGKIANSLLVAYMPTAGTAQIVGSSESFEPLQSNMFIRQLEGGREYYMINKYLVKDLEKLGLWDETTKDDILRNNGSISNLEYIPLEIRNVYKTVWEIPQKVLIDIAADRQEFIDQSQSLNLYLAEPNASKVGSMLMYAWKKGLKTGCYYLKTKPKNQANINLGVKRIEVVKKPQNTLFNCDGCSA